MLFVVLLRVPLTASHTICSVLAGQEAPLKESAEMVAAPTIVNNYTRPEGQNVGNFLTDKNSSRVIQPPGGRSQISFGGDSEGPSAVKTKVTDSFPGEESFLDDTAQVIRPPPQSAHCLALPCLNGLHRKVSVL